MHKDFLCAILSTLYQQSTITASFKMAKPTWNRRKKQELLSMRGGKAAAELTAAVPSEPNPAARGSGGAPSRCSDSRWYLKALLQSSYRTWTPSLGSAPGTMHRESRKNQPTSFFCSSSVFLCFLLKQIFGANNVVESRIVCNRSRSLTKPLISAGTFWFCECILNVVTGCLYQNHTAFGFG